MSYKKFLKIKYVCAILLILSLIVSIFVPILPSVDPIPVSSEFAEPIRKK